ncbi:MAG: ribosome assembly RNA-binding protein YhbY [Burkholderiales bacterium]|nr:ribosome assembly RNA-binding protein YhbY [Burkholderiales bacterium]
MAITPTERSALKARAHALDPVILIGGNGLTPGVLQEIDTSLKAHELIKIRVADEDRDARKRMLEEICRVTGAEAVQTIGRILVIYRVNLEAPKKTPVRRKRKPVRPSKRSFQNDD